LRWAKEEEEEEEEEPIILACINMIYIPNYEEEWVSSQYSNKTHHTHLCCLYYLFTFGMRWSPKRCNSHLELGTIRVVESPNTMLAV
jgi:hypothetical protein